MLVHRQLAQFIDLFKSTLSATFSNPWVFLKQSSANLEDVRGPVLCWRQEQPLAVVEVPVEDLMIKDLMLKVLVRPFWI